jgi:hypothetical protein
LVIREILFSSVICSLSLPAYAAGANCPVFPVGAEPSDGQLFYRDGRSLAELKLSDQIADRTPNPVQFYYVLREASDEGRAGFVVIKSGRKLGSDETGEALQSKLVHLKRSKKSIANNYPCDVPSAFDETSVAAESYDNYHDYAYDPRNKEEYEGDFHTLSKFHVRRYLGRNKACKNTDSSLWDGLLRLDFRSNRSQFSFDPIVVAFGIHSQAWKAIRQTVGGGSTGLADQRVRMKQYQTDDSKITCIPFTLNVRGRDFFLRINDLESGILRKPEGSWQLTK